MVAVPAGNDWRKKCDTFTELKARDLLWAIFSPSAVENMSVGRISVVVLEAANLPAADLGGTSDPYATVEMSGLYGLREKSMREWDYGTGAPKEKGFHGLFGRTNVVAKDLNPCWFHPGEISDEDKWYFSVPRHGAVLKVRVYDYDATSADDLLATLDIPVDDLLADGMEDGWWRLSKPDSLSWKPGELDPAKLTDISAEQIVAQHSGAAIRLRIELERNEFAEFTSYLWPPPPIKPRVFAEKFDPNDALEDIVEAKNAAIRFMAEPAQAFLNALKWKSPLISLLLLTYAYFVTYHIEYFWVIFHFTIGCLLIATGIQTGFGQKSRDKTEVNREARKEEHHSTPPIKRVRSMKTAALNVSAGLRARVKSPVKVSPRATPTSVNADDSSTGSDDLDGSTSGGSSKNKLPWAVSAGLKSVLHKAVGKQKLDGMQHDLKEMRDSLELFERTIFWQRKNGRMNSLSACAAAGNFAISVFHLMVPLRYPAIAMITGLFSFFWVDHFSKMLPLVKKRVKNRLKQRRDKNFSPPRLEARRLSDRPVHRARSTSSRKGNAELILESIFRRIDNDGSQTVSLEELLKALPTLAQHQKDVLVRTFERANTLGELTYGDFKAMMLRNEGEAARMLVSAEFKRQLLTKQGTALTKLPVRPPRGVALKFVNYIAMSPGTERDARPAEFRAHKSGLRVVKNPADPHGPATSLQYLRRNVGWSEEIGREQICGYEVIDTESSPPDGLRILLDMKDKTVEGDGEDRASLLFKIKFAEDICSALQDLLPPYKEKSE